MLALSIRQPWAWLILHAGKDVENRSWPTSVRGRFLLHASKTVVRRDYERVVEYAHDIVPEAIVPGLEEIERGGIVGSIELVDCVWGYEYESVWSDPCQYSFVLSDPRVLPFTPTAGRLGFFKSLSEEDLI